MCFQARYSRTAASSSSIRRASGARKISSLRCLRCALPRVLNASRANTSALASPPLRWNVWRGCTMTSRASSVSGMSPVPSGATVTAAKLPRPFWLLRPSRSTISAQTSSGRSRSRSASSLAARATDGWVSYQYRVPSEYRYVAWSASMCRDEAKWPMLSPGTAVPSQIRCWSMPLCALRRVAAEPRKMVRASRWVSARWPNTGRSWSIRAGSALGPSTSESMIDFQESSRYWVRSSKTRGSPSGMVAGMISG